MHDVTAISLRNLIVAENRRVLGEAGLTILVGFVTTVLVFGGVFWITWLAFFLFLHSFVIGSASTTALIVTGVFAIVSIWSAWRQYDPISDVQAMDSNLHELSIGLGYAMGVPVVNRQSLAGFASLLIGGPANLLESWSLWRSLLPSDGAAVAHAALILQGSRTGFPAQQVTDGRAVAMLARLGLIKSQTDRQRGVMIVCTQKGLEALVPNALKRT